MKAIYTILLLVLIVLDLGCPIVGSRTYRPLDWEEPLLTASDKSIMPSDVRTHPSKYLGLQIHWVGVIDTLLLTPQGMGVFASLLVDQKYYDYIEDFGSQHEKMFVSPYGEGKFFFDRVFRTTSIDSIRLIFHDIGRGGNLVFCYGTLSTIRDSMPVLEAKSARFVPSDLFATNIMSYRVKRDSLGNVMLDARGFPDLTDYEILDVR